MDLSKKEFIEKYRKERPAVANFAECITRAYMTGVAFFGIGAVSFHLTQSYFKEKLPYAPKVQLALSLFFGAGLAYQVGKEGFRQCQAAFLEEEGKAPHQTTGIQEDISNL